MRRPARELLERDEEQSLLAQRVAATAAGEGAVVVVEGPAGVGKTELVRAACELAQDAGLRVLRARGSELDRAFSFGLVRQLLAQEVARDPGLLTQGAELAGPVLGPAGDQPAGEPLALLEGLQWLVANLAARTPLLIAADDLHWSDRSSLRWLVFLAERIEDVPVLLVAATRPGEPEADQDLLDVLATGPSTTRIRPAPLSSPATATIVRGRLPGATETFATACHRGSGGNPFLLGELIEEVAADGRTGTDDEARGVVEFGAERVSNAVRRRLRAQPAETLALGEALAVLGPSTTLNRAAALAGLDEWSAGQAADALVAVNLLAADPELDFVHPLVRAAVYTGLAPQERRRRHAAAARMLQSQGAGAEEVARHLIQLTPSGDGEAVASLRAAAREATARGDLEAALRYLRRALEEPPTGRELGSVLHELALAEAADRQIDQASARFREAIARTDDAEARGRIARDFGAALLGNGRHRLGYPVLEQGLREIDAPDGPLGIELEAATLAVANYILQGRSEMIQDRLRHRLAQLEAGEDLAPSTVACLLFPIVAHRGPARAAVVLVDEVLPRVAYAASDPLIGAPFGLALLMAGSLERAGRFFDDGIAGARRSGARTSEGWLSVLRSWVSLPLGELRRAESEARLAFALFDEHAQDGWVLILAQLADALVAQGKLDEADALFERPVPEGASVTYPSALFLASRARLHLACGRFRLALQDAQEVGRLASPTISNPLCVAWREPAARALACLNRDDDARELAEAELADARRLGVPLAEGTALRTLALVTGGDAGLQMMRESVAVLEGTEGRHSFAQSVLELGAALRRAGERAEARDVLREALAMTSSIGASGLADRAHEELLAAGARPRRDRRLLTGREALTASEDRVALLAAEGLTNREIAQRLFVTLKAVQWHLRNVYRKLDISSREELPEALGLAPEPA